MKEVSKQKEKSDGHEELVNEGSAARTRPTSVEEIMLRRKRKETLENLKEETVGAAELLGKDIVEKVSDYHEPEKGHDRSKKVRREERVKDSSSKKEDSISSTKEEKLKKTMIEDPVGAAQSQTSDLVEKFSDYHASEKGHDRSKKVRSEERVKDNSSKKEDAISNSREATLMKEDPVGEAASQTNDLVEKFSDYHASEKGHDRSKERVKDSSSKKEDAISNSREEKPMKEDLVGTAQLLGNDLVKKVSDYPKSNRSEKLRREERVKDSSRKKEDAISSSREERLDKPKRGEEPTANRKRKAEGERSRAETKLVEEHIKDRRRKKEETNSSYKEERLDKKMKKEDLASNRKMSIEGECSTTETKTMTDRDGLGVDTKMKSKRESHAAKTTEKQIHPQDTGREQARSAPENLPGSRKRLRSLVVADIPRDENSIKPDDGDKRKNQNGDHKKNRERNMSKRHDPGKVHSVQVSERWEKREQSKSHQRDMREKRRRSRSRDHGQDRQKRSSPLPRAEKATSRHKRGHEEDLENAVIDKSGKHQFNDNENKAASTVNNKSRRYSGSKSELGGYSPRKRREDTSAKAASAPNLSSEKKSGKWDLTPTVTAGIFSGSAFSGLQAATQTAYPSISEASLTLLKPLMEAPFRTQPARQTTSVDSVQLTESTRLMRRLYAENVPDSASEKSLIEYFNGYMLSSGSNHIKGSEPCISCIINKEKSQALVEFLTPQDASAALSLDGCSFAGANLKIRRPKDYVETTLMEIVSVFGPLKAYRFVINNDLNQRCAFLEYTDGSLTPKACAGLNGMKLGGNVITAVCARPDASSVAVNENPPFYGIPEHAKPLLGKPKHILKLKNVVDPEDFPSLSEAEVKAILEDVRFECARFGVIKSINIVGHQSKDITGWGTDASLNPETTESKETSVSLNQEKDEGSKKANDIVDHVDPEEVVRPDSSTVEDTLIEPYSDTAVETNTQANEDHDESSEKIDRENVPDEPENPQEVVGSARAVKTRWDTGEKIEEEEDPKDVFEPGCIFIEYRRPEATRDAAHSLHGRLYENRIVKAEYVSKELYQTRFPSG
ncbi:unnamed protein product [Arabis nemorensis]|uniref:RRM domain-containing protein n=1 Tax=Arabis nemorensis TaxID=586526 RepID=A0A565C0T1_9BRAS|nr:unnamed protein product [Arabis nemorensis]